MGQIVSFHPKIDMNIFYEVVGEDDRAVWGGESPSEAIQFFRRTNGARVIVSAWSGDEDDFHAVGVPIDVTSLLRSLIAEVR